MDYKDLAVTQSNGVVTACINRPDRLNAFQPNTVAELADVIGVVARSGDAKVLVLTGTGRAFCTGGDVAGLPERIALPAMVRRQGLRERHRLLLDLRELEKPVIAAINGLAVGGGLGLALACDVLIASDAARFGASFLRIGSAPDFGVTYFLPRTVGLARALHLFYTSRLIDAAEAERLGLVSRVVPAAALTQETQDLAESLARGPSAALSLLKCTVYKGMELGLKEALDFEIFSQTVCSQTKDNLEGVTAFLEKRASSFIGG